MRQCDRCLENRWSFKCIERTIFATCEGCGYEVSFAAKGKKSAARVKKPSGIPKVKITEEGQPCRHCNTPVKKKTHATPPKENSGSYWFEWWFKCPKCHTLYMVKEAQRQFAPKVLVDRRPDKMPAFQAKAQTDAYLHQDPGEDITKPPWD